MGFSWLRWGCLGGLSVLVVACGSRAPGTQSPARPSASSTPSRSPTPEQSLEYALLRSPQANVHLLRIPAQSRWVVTAGIAETTQTVEAFATQTGAIAVLNGGFFDPVNQKSTSPVTVRGQPVAQPEENERLITNPDLLPYLDKILNRSEFRQYRCGQTIRYDITLRQTLPPPTCQIEAAIGGGPQLLPTDTAELEGFVVQQNGQQIRDALGYTQPNARSAIGIRPDGSVVLVLVAQISGQGAKSGLSLPELAAVMRQQGIVKALNLDGGSSSALYYQGEVFTGKVNEAGAAIDRPVKSVVLVQSNPVSN